MNNRFAQIAAFATDETTIALVRSVMENAGIQCEIEGSVFSAIWVAKSDALRASTLLREDGGLAGITFVYPGTNEN